jgi:hypothetical protein
LKLTIPLSNVVFFAIISITLVSPPVSGFGTKRGGGVFTPWEKSGGYEVPLAGGVFSCGWVIYPNFPSHVDLWHTAGVVSGGRQGV